MTRSETITRIYMLFNAPHNADINLVALNKVLDDLVSEEREACAKVCEHIDTEYEGEDVLATWCAAAIRARGEE